MAKRTKAQRRAAAKAGWLKRKGESEASAPTPRKTSAKLPEVSYAPGPKLLGMIADAGVKPQLEIKQYADDRTFEPITASAVQEGADFYVTVATNGSVYRHRLPRALIRKLGMDCLQLVG